MKVAYLDNQTQDKGNITGVYLPKLDEMEKDQKVN